MASDQVEVLPHNLCAKAATSHEKLWMVHLMRQSLKRQHPNVSSDHYHHAD